MKEQFLKFIDDHKLFESNDSCLLTVSGGIDSIAMLYLFYECGFNFAVAHCNFSLRGEESDGDEAYVTKIVREMKIPFHVIRFNTVEYATKHKLSIQMAARDLRYGWFEELSNKYQYKWIATAHNANDVVETFFINLTRGTGIHGLTGINLVNKNVIRPLLFATRSEINHYVEQLGVMYREDSTNADTKYMRNAIRHNILPELERLNPAFLSNVINTTQILAEVENVYEKHLLNMKDDLFQKSGDGFEISFEHIREQNVSPCIFYELLQPYGFTFDASEKMLNLEKGQSGSVFYSDKWKMVRDREAFYLNPLKETEVEEYFIYEGDEQFKGPVSFQIKHLKAEKNFVLKRNKEVGIFDAGKLSFPLRLRKWQQGDYFYPFGMKGKKKLSDYFINQKLSLFDKENVWILCSGEDIIWVVNHRTDNRFCITKSTKEVVQVELIF